MEWSDESLLALARTSLEYSAFVSRKPKRRVVRRLLYATAASKVALYMSTRLVSDELARALARTSCGLWLLRPTSAVHVGRVALYMSTWLVER